MNNVEDYLKAHEIKSKGFREYDNLKATLIASMSGTTLYNDDMYLYGKRIVEILNPNR